MEYDFSIYPQIHSTKTNPGKWMKANARILTSSLAIDKLMGQALDRKLCVQHLSTDFLHEIKIKISFVDADLTEEESAKLTESLGLCKQCVFKHLSKIKGPQDFAEFYQTIMEILSEMAKKHFLIKPKIWIPKYEFVKIFLSLSDIAELRSNAIEYIYSDNVTEMTIHNLKKLRADDLLPPKHPSSETQTLIIDVTNAPIDGSDHFRFRHERDDIDHLMLDKDFEAKWVSGEIEICCHDKFKVLCNLEENSNTGKITYIIIKVLQRIRRENSKQESFDF